MKRLLFFLLLASCAHTYRTGEGGAPARLCSTPIEIYVPYNEPVLQHAVIASFVYWNSSTKVRLFAPGGTTTPPLNSIYVSFSDMDYNTYSSREVYFSKPRQCTVGARISIQRHLSERDDGVMDTVLRREAGFLLGLDTTSDITDLMYYRIDTDAPHPLDASDEELTAVRNLYR
jgi:hypothetical protein